MRLIDRGSDSEEVATLPVGLKLFALSAGRSRLQLHQYLDPGLPPQEWQTLSLVAKLPMQTEFLKVNLYREADGLVQVRNPSLQLIGKGSGPCVAGSAN
jgi:hypothetical protein